VTVDGKRKKVTTLKPVATAIAEWKAQNGQGSESDQSDQSNQSNQNTPSNPSTPSTQNYALTISTSGSGSATVTHDGNALTSGSNLNEDDEVEISITPAEDQIPTATVNGSSIELTEDGGVYTGSFAMPGEASTLLIDTGTAEGEDDGGDGLDKD